LCEKRRQALYRHRASCRQTKEYSVAVREEMMAEAEQGGNSGVSLLSARYYVAAAGSCAP
jgi:hypothetical protein